MDTNNYYKAISHFSRYLLTIIVSLKQAIEEMLTS